MDLKFNQIIVGNRGRKELKDLGGLAESIKTYGVIEPVVVTPSDDGRFHLIAGERRFRAAALAGVATIPAVLRENVSEAMKVELELEENLHREELLWTEEADLKLRINILQQARHGRAVPGVINSKAHTLEKFADSLGESVGKVSQDLQLAKFLRANPEMIESLGKLPKTAAMRKIKRIQEAEVLKTSTRKPEDEPFELGDARELIRHVLSGSVDCILTDPPYGLGEDSGMDVGGNVHTMIESGDNLGYDEARELFVVICPDLFRVLKPGRHIYVFCAYEISFLFRTCMIEAGFSMTVNPIIWFKGKGQTAGTGLSYRRSYELVLFGYKPAPTMDIRSLTSHSLDVVTCPPLTPTQRHHAFEKPRELLRTFMTQSTLKYETLFDPFAGPATLLRAAKASDRRAVCFEESKLHYAKGMELLEKGE